MALEPLYKPSAVGPIPSDWDVKLLGELGDVVRGGSPRPAGDPRFFGGDFIPWLTVASLTGVPESQLVITQTNSKLTELGSRFSRTLPSGVLTIVNSGAKTLGVAKILAMACCANDGIAALINQTGGDKRFLCYYLNSQTKRLREVVAAGNDQLNLNTGRIAQIAVPFPEPAEQCTIADALSDVDALLAALVRKISKKRDLMQAISQQLLSGQTRLPSFNKPWQPELLGRVADIIKGSALSKATVSSSGSRACILYGELFTKYGRAVTVVNGRTSSPLGLASRAGDILMPGSTTTVGADLATASALLVDDVAIGSDVVVIRMTGNEYDPVFLAHYLTNVKRRQIAERTQGITIHHLYGRALKDLPVDLPELAEQQAIAGVLGDLDKELEHLQARAAKTAALKQGMVQQLLTGKTRLKTREAADA